MNWYNRNVDIFTEYLDEDQIFSYGNSLLLEKKRFKSIDIALNNPNEWEYYNGHGYIHVWPGEPYIQSVLVA